MPLMDYQRAYKDVLTELDFVKRELSSVVKASRSVLEAKSFIHSARSIFDLARDITGAESGYIALLSATGEENEVLFLESGGLPCTVDPSLPMPIRGLREEAYRLKRPVYHNDFLSSQWVKFMPGGHVRLRNVLFAPLVLEDKAVGIIGLANKNGDFSDRDAEVASHFGELAAISLQHSRDQDGRRLAEQQRRTLIAEQKDIMEKLERSNAELDEFAHIISHDLKEPLRSISSFIGFLKDDYGEKLSSRGRETLGIVKNSAERMAGLIDDLLHYSRVGRVELSFLETDVGEIVRGVLSRLELSAKDVQISMPREWPRIVCDKIRVGEIYHNLILNGIKYNNSERKLIEIGYEQDARSEGQYVFFVRDNGIGIKEEHKDNIFKIFRRLHGRGQFGGGTGSGLTIAHRIVQRHRGKIWLESQPGIGSTFFFTLGEDAPAATTRSNAQQSAGHAH